MAERITLRGITCQVCDCISCGIPFTVPLSVYEKHRGVGGYHSCPNGHQQGWDKSRSQREAEQRQQDEVRRERDRLKQRLAEKDDEIRSQQEMREAAERRASAARGQVTKLKNRASAGVCPCCNRTFSQLARHMASKHPNFAAEALPGDGVSVH